MSKTKKSMTAISYIEDPDDAELTRAWQALAKRVGSLAGWQYMGSGREDDGLWWHHFRNRQLRDDAGYDDEAAQYRQRVQAAAGWVGAPEATKIIIPPKVIRAIREETEQNDLCTAYVMGAKALGCEELAVQFDGIRQQKLRSGELSQALYEERYRLYEMLKNEAKEKLSPEDYRTFYMLF